MPTARPRRLSMQIDFEGAQEPQPPSSDYPQRSLWSRYHFTMATVPLFTIRFFLSASHAQRHDQTAMFMKGRADQDILHTPRGRSKCQWSGLKVLPEKCETAPTISSQADPPMGPHSSGQGRCRRPGSAAAHPPTIVHGLATLLNWLGGFRSITIVDSQPHMACSVLNMWCWRDHAGMPRNRAPFDSPSYHS